MTRLALALALLVAPAALAGASAVGTWRLLPAAPIAVDSGLTSVWTGREMLLFGRHVTRRSEDGAVFGSVNVAAAYDPAANSWRRLSPPAGPTGYFPGRYSAVWTGKELVAWGSVDVAFDPATNRWRRLARAPSGGRRLVVWSGHEMIGWGGGCCGDAVADGVAYNPEQDSWRKLSRSPLAGSQNPTGAWDGRELIILVGGFDPEGKPWPARLARAAAYNPVKDTWRRIAPPPLPRYGATAVWDGRELLVVGGTGAHGGAAAPAAVGLAYDPSTNHWRKLPRMESGRLGAATVWTGRRLLVWGGRTGPSGTDVPGHGLAYDPKLNRWSALPPAPISGRADPTAVWTGHSMIVWGGANSQPSFADGAAFTPQNTR